MKQALFRLTAHDAIIWKDACLLYLQAFSHAPIPAGVEPPVRTLEELKMREFMPVSSGVDSVFVSALTSGDDGKAGLQLAWRTEGGKQRLVGNGYAFLRSDYGPWGSDKRLYNPVLFRCTKGLWHCVFDVDPSGETKGYTVSDDRMPWKPQHDLPAGEMAAYTAPGCSDGRTIKPSARERLRPAFPNQSGVDGPAYSFTVIKVKTK